MTNDLQALLAPYLAPGITLGIVGLGTFGTQIRDLAQARGIHILLCDPPRSMDDAEELADTFQQLWGNGMGGCQLSNEGLETFLPLQQLTAADVIAIQVPLTEDGPFKTRGLIARDFLVACRPTLRILCFSAPEVIAEDCRADARIRFMAP